MSKEKIAKSLLSSCNKNLRKKVESYLFEGKDEGFTKSELDKVKFYNHNLFSELDIFNRNKTLKKSEDNEIIKKLFTLGYNYYPEKLIADLNNFIPRLSFYKDLNFSEEFIIQDIEEDFKNSNKTNIIHFEYLISEVIKKFPNLLESYLNSDLKSKNRYAIALLLNKKILKGDTDKVEDLERFILVSLSEIYSKERVGNILKFDVKREDLLWIVKDVQTVEYDDQLVNFLRKIYENIGISAPNREDILTILEIFLFNEEMKHLGIEDKERYCDYIINSKLPIIYKLVYIYQGGKELDIFPRLIELIEKNISSCEELLERMCSQNIELGSFILGVLFEKLEKNRADTYIKLYEKKLVELIAELDKNADKELEIRVINSLGHMLVFSDVEEEIKSLDDYYQKNNKDEKEFINLISHYERLNNKDEKNPWEIVGRNTTIDKKFLIIGTLNFVMIKSRTQFTKFLKDNEEIFYELLDRRAFIGFDFLEIMEYSYDTVTKFDCSRLLSYLEGVHEILLEKLFDVLKDKEDELSQEVVKIKSKKNKKSLKNIAKLEKIWEKNRKIEFKNIEELEEYCKLKLKEGRRDIPYNKSEGYRGVRAKDSERIVVGEVIQYYVAMNIINSGFEDIGIGKSIRKLLNLEDLRECVGSLYIEWVNNKMPRQYLNLVRVLSQIADEFWIDKLLNQCDINISNKKFELAEDWITLMLLSQNKIVNTEIQFIEFGLKYNRINDFLNSDLLMGSIALEILDDVFQDRFDLSIGFNENGEKILNYGRREISLKLDKDFKLLIKNQDDKDMKSLPKFSSKFEDSIERVEFYQREFKIFKKKREILTQKLREYFFYQMIGEKTWNMEAWREEIEKYNILREFSKNIVWENQDKILCIYDEANRKFLDLANKKDLKIENIKLFYSGDCEEKQVESIKKLAIDVGLNIYDLQFEIKRIDDRNIGKYKHEYIFEDNLIEAIVIYFANYFSSIQNKIVLLNKVDRNFIDITITPDMKGQIIERVDVYNELRENIGIERLNKRFLNYSLFILDYIIK